MQHPIDFDVPIKSIQLVHKTVLESGVFLDVYRNGRALYGITCPISGGSRFTFEDGRVVDVKPGDVALIAADAAYRVCTMGTEHCDHYTVNFEVGTAILKEWMNEEPICVLKPHNLNSYQSRLDEMVYIWQKRKSCLQMRERAHLLLLLSDFLKECVSPQLDVATYTRILPAKEMIETRYCEHLTLGMLADSCQMKISNFRHAFVSVFQQAPMDYLKHCRIERAKELLLLGFSPSNAAEQCGFQDICYFSRVFRQVVGKSPRQYQKSL